ncbi:MAG: hypothetical protein ACRD8W_17575 [Nitrososphaeraceae archaeon]
MIQLKHLAFAVITFAVTAIMTTTNEARAQSLNDLTQGLNDMVTDIKNDGDVLKAEIASTDLNGTGKVQDLITKVYYFEGQVSAMGGGTWAYLHDVQDALIDKIKETGQAGFTVPEQAAIDSFATNAEQSKLEHPSTNVFG